MEKRGRNKDGRKVTMDKEGAKVSTGDRSFG
jgi:hypothetical protein